MEGEIIKIFMSGLWAGKWEWEDQVGRGREVELREGIQGETAATEGQLRDDIET